MEKPLRNILIGFGAVSVIILVSVYFTTGTLEGFWVNTATEIIGIILTVAFIDYYYRQREEKELKVKLIREMGSRDNADALKAVSELRAKGWLQDGSLNNLYIQYADLKNADLSLASLTNCNFDSVNFEGANLFYTNFSSSEIRNSDFKRAMIIGTIFRETKLLHTDFTGVSYGRGNSLSEEATHSLFCNALALRRSIMPNGMKYDGRYRLHEELSNSSDSDHITHAQGWANYYGITVEQYLEGQKWADENLHKYRKDEEDAK